MKTKKPHLEELETFSIEELSNALRVLKEKAEVENKEKHRKVENNIISSLPTGFVERYSKWRYTEDDSFEINTVFGKFEVCYSIEDGEISSFIDINLISSTNPVVKFLFDFVDHCGDLMDYINDGLTKNPFITAIRKEIDKKEEDIRASFEAFNMEVEGLARKHNIVVDDFINILDGLADKL